ncbi:hypothetical protein E2C01_061520 [Portunus trituberculatus]|uniref:Uncharacterized protein n=1 Tax=Portunus trituberculatus TaxID=210409 RepID=A0A5B7HCL5_PORTR|nr:hypothetical protein [Portunus trituberculatus]
MGATNLLFCCLISRSPGKQSTIGPGLSLDKPATNKLQLDSNIRSQNIGEERWILAHQVSLPMSIESRPRAFTGARQKLDR